MYKYLIMILFALPVAVSAQSDNFIPDFASPLPFKGLKGKPKVVIEKCMEAHFEPKGDTLCSEPYYIEKTFFAPDGKIDSTQMIWPQHMSSLYYNEADVPYKVNSYNIVGADTILTKINENTYTWLTSDTVLTICRTTNIQTMEISNRIDTTLVNYKEHSITNGPFDKKNVSFYDQGRLIKSIIENGTYNLTTEYLYSEGRMIQVKYSRKGEDIGGIDIMYLQFDKEGNWLRQIMQDDRRVAGNMMQRQITYY